MLNSKRFISAKLIVMSLFLGISTWFAIGALSYLPYSTTRDAVSDALASPGGLIASVFYPQGTHTGLGSPAALYLAIAGNIVVYALFWVLVIQLARRIVKGNRPHPSDADGHTAAR
jgi:hypothetical protein